jgi:hypothetical protein
MTKCVPSLYAETTPTLRKTYACDIIHEQIRDVNINCDGLRQYLSLAGPFKEE